VELGANGSEHEGVGKKQESEIKLEGISNCRLLK
jgi:hypothetical protein